MTTIESSLKKSRDRFPVTELLLLLVAMFWGTSYGITKSALVYTSVLVFISIRFSITFLFMLPVVIRDFHRGLNKNWVISIPTGIILSAIFFCEVYGVSQTSASNAAFLISLTVIFTAFAELVINKKRVSNMLLGLTVCSVVGVLLLTSEQSIDFSLNIGDYFILTAALLRAVMVTLTKRFTEGKEITTSTLTSLQALVVATSAIAGALIYFPDSDFFLPTSTEFWIMIAYLVLFCTLFAFYIQNYAVRRTSPTKVSLLMGSEPLFGAIFALVWLQESLSYLQLLGGVLILCSVVVISTRQNE